MALTVPCPKCGTKLLAPDTAVGQRLRCPSCGTLAPVPDLLPAEEVEVVEAKIVQPPPGPKPIRAEAVDEADRPRAGTRRDGDENDRPRKRKRPRYAAADDEYEHDKPRKKKRPRSGGGGGGALVAGLVIGGLVLLAGVGFLVYLFAGKGAPPAKKTPVPGGWEQHSFPQDGFKVYLPKPPKYVSVPADGPGWNRFGGRNTFGPAGFDPGDLPGADRAAIVSSGEWNDQVHVELYVIRFRDRIPSSVRDKMRQGGDEVKLGEIEMRRIKWLGYDAVEQTHPGGAMRVVYTDRHIVLATIGGSQGRARPEEEAGFFDNIEVTN